MAFEGDSGVDLQKFLKKAKKKVASGGTVRGKNEVELMGDHRFKLKRMLIDEGIPEENIVIR